MSRVLQLVTVDEPGGVQVLTRMMEPGLRQRGHEVTTLALKDGPVAMVRAIWSGRYDAILSYHVAASLVGGAVGWLARVPIRAAHITALPAALRPHWRLLDRLWGTCGLHSMVIANSGATAVAIADYPAGYRRRTKVIAHGVTPLPHADAHDWRSELGIAPLAAMLVTSGRLAEQKNHAVAVAALAHLPTVHLVIAGGGSLEKTLLQQAAELGVSERLHLVGDLDRESLASLLRAGDIYVFPSAWESFGLAVVEAAMEGLPIVAADLPVLREVLASAGNLASFHAPDDAVALSEAVAARLDHYPDPDARETAAATVKQAHGVEKMIDAYCCLLEGTI